VARPAAARLADAGNGGAVVIEAMRAHPLPLPEKTIVVSALDVALLRDQVAKIGIETVLQKPLSPKLLREVVNGKAAETLPAFSAQQRQQGRLAGMRVLVVEDNEINQQVAAEVLAAWGVSVDLAGDGRQALSGCFPSRRTLTIWC
jgi:CheY-like chemotaxis protein